MPESKQTDVAFKKTLFLQRQLSPPSVGPPPPPQPRAAATPTLLPANTSACLFNLSLFHLHSRTHFENLSLSAARPSNQGTGHSSAASLPLHAQRYCVAKRCLAPYLACAAAAAAPARRRISASLQPACANFILHTTAPRSHYIAWLGLLQKKTNDGRSCTDTSELFSFTLPQFQ